METFAAHLAASQRAFAADHARLGLSDEDYEAAERASGLSVVMALGFEMHAILDDALSQSSN